MEQINIENGRIGYKNFSGAKENFDKGFVVFLEKEQADSLSVEGWNIQYKQNNEGEEYYYLPVKIGDSALIHLIPEGSEIVNLTYRGSDNLEMLDWTDILKTDIVISPYIWDHLGKSGVKAYLKAIYITVKVDPFAKKYGIV